MKGFYIENFVLRILFCIVGFIALWFATKFITRNFIFHEEFNVGVMDFIIPVALGVVESVIWKPKNK